MLIITIVKVSLQDKTYNEIKENHQVRLQIHQWSWWWLLDDQTLTLSQSVLVSLWL